jgi:hypothetical protein
MDGERATSRRTVDRHDLNGVTLPVILPRHPGVVVRRVADERPAVEPTRVDRARPGREQRPAHRVDRQHQLGQQPRVGSETGELVALNRAVHDLLDALDEIGVHAAGRRRGRADRPA